MSRRWSRPPFVELQILLALVEPESYRLESLDYTDFDCTDIRHQYLKDVSVTYRLLGRALFRSVCGIFGNLQTNYITLAFVSHPSLQPSTYHCKTECNPSR